jgi:hypothetical protein
MVWAHFDSIPAHTAFRADIRVSKWPNPDTNRTKNAFRMQLGEGMPFPRPQRYKLWMDFVPEAPNNRLYPIIDLDQTGEFELFGTSGEDISGREVEMSIIQHLEDDFPGSHGSGIEYAFKFKQIGFDDYHEQWFFENDHFGDNFRDNPMMESSIGSPLTLHRIADVPSELNLTWPINDVTPQFNWEPMSECWTFLPGDLQQLFAEFNGVDSYIRLDHDLVNVNSDFVIEAEIRLHDPDNFWPLMGRDGSGGFLGMEGSDFIFGNLRLATSWTPLLNQWFTWRLEFEQPLQLKYMLFIDDVEVMDRTTNRQSVQFNTLGVYRHGVSGTKWAHMDVKLLKFLTGTAPSSVVALDMPMAQDSCDQGPDENHGEAFEMDLPTCPL